MSGRCPHKALPGRPSRDGYETAANYRILTARANPAGAANGSPRRILVPLDGSLRAESVLPTAVRIASAHDAEVLLVFVVREQVATSVLCAPEDLKIARREPARPEVADDARASAPGSGRGRAGSRATITLDGTPLDSNRIGCGSIAAA